MTDRRALRERLAALESTAGDRSVFAELWKRSAAGENPLEDPAFRDRVIDAGDRGGYPDPWGDA
jgi:hypothetical protein